MDNTDTTDNFSDFKKNDEYIDALLDLSYDQLQEKYDKDEFFKYVFETQLQDDIVLLRNSLTDDFLPPNNDVNLKPTVLTPIQSDTILQTLATDTIKNPEQILTQIKTVLPQATLPQNFDLADYTQRAIRIYNGLYSLKKFLSERNAHEYLSDLNTFLKTPDEKLKIHLADIDLANKKLQTQYENLLNAKSPDPKVLDEAIDVIGKCGRTPLQIANLKEKKNLGIITDILFKIKQAIQITLYAKASNLPTASEEDQLTAISNYLISNLHLS